MKLSPAPARQSAAPVSPREGNNVTNGFRRYRRPNANRGSEANGPLPLGPLCAGGGDEGGGSAPRRPCPRSYGTAGRPPAAPLRFPFPQKGPIDPRIFSVVFKTLIKQTRIWFPLRGFKPFFNRRTQEQHRKRFELSNVNVTLSASNRRRESGIPCSPQTNAAFTTTVPRASPPGVPLSRRQRTPTPPSGFCLRTTLTSHPGSADSSAFPFLLHCVSPRISALGTAAVGLNQNPTGNAAKSPVSPLPHTPTPREQRGIIYISAATQNEGAEGERHFGLQDGRPRAARPGAPPQPSDAR